jgi:hypothetical protein
MRFQDERNTTHPSVHPSHRPAIPYSLIQQYGFVLPPHLIRPTGEEVSAGIRYLATFIWASD